MQLGLSLSSIINHIVDRSKHLAENSFRTFHPGYGNREYDWYQGVMDKIAEFVKNELNHPGVNFIFLSGNCYRNFIICIAK